MNCSYHFMDSLGNNRFPFNDNFLVSNTTERNFIVIFDEEFQLS